MVKAARKYERIVQCGSQQRSMKECRIGCELVRNGKSGKSIPFIPPYSPAPDQPFLPSRFRMDWTGIPGWDPPERAYHTDLFTRVKPGWISIVTYSGGRLPAGVRTDWIDSMGDGDGCQRSGGNLDGRRKSS